MGVVANDASQVVLLPGRVLSVELMHLKVLHIEIKFSQHKILVELIILLMTRIYS